MFITQFYSFCRVVSLVSIALVVFYWFIALAEILRNLDWRAISATANTMSSNVQIQYVSADMGDSDPLFEQFKGIFEKFARPEELLQDDDEANDTSKDAEADEKDKEE